MLLKYISIYIYFKISHKQLSNLIIPKNIKKECTPSFHGIHLTCYIKIKLLYNFTIVELIFSFQI